MNLGSILIQHDLFLTLLYLQNHYFQIVVSRVETVAFLFWRHTHPTITLMLPKDKTSCCFSGPVVRGFLVFTVFISFHSVFQSLPAKFQVTDTLLRNGQEVYEYNQNSYYPDTLMVTSMKSCRFYPCKRNLNRTYFQLEVPLINWYSKTIQFELFCPKWLNKINLKYHWSCKAYRFSIMKPVILHNM